MKHIRFRATFAVLLLLLLLLPMLVCTVLADHNALIDTSRRCTLTVDYPYPNVEFRVFRVADVRADGTLQVTGQFANASYGFSLNDYYRAPGELAQMLSDYAYRDNLTPDAKKLTGTSGDLTMTDLKTGLYLITWKRHIRGQHRYIPHPTLFMLPQQNVTDGSYLYDITLYPKYEDEMIPQFDETIRRRVHKVWNDGQNKEDRTETVTVQLLCDSAVYETVTLSAENGWSYEWDHLDDDRAWRVVEVDVPDGYTVLISQEGITFVVTNTKTEDETTPPSPPPETAPPEETTVPPDETAPPPDETTPPPEETTAPVETTLPDETTPPDETEPPETDAEETTAPPPDDNPPDVTPPKEPELPQTGLLWWPVPVLAVLGMVLFAAGYFLRRTEE